MKKLLVVLLALAMIFAFAACGDQAPAEEPAAEEAEAITVSLEEGLPTLTLEETAAPWEVTEDLTAVGMYEYYENAWEDCDLAMYDFAEAFAGKTAEEIAAEIGKDLSGCVESHDWDGVPYQEVSYFYEDEETDARYLVTTCVFDGAEGAVGYSFLYHVEEVQVAGTPLYMWMPKYYSSETVSDEQAASEIVGFYESNSEYLPDITVYSWPAGQTYEEDNAYWTANNPEMAISEEEYNAAVGDALTLDNIKDYYVARGLSFSEQLAYDNDGLKSYIFEYQKDVDGVEMNCVFIDYLIDGQFYELHMSMPMNLWPGIGKAYMEAMSVK